MSRKVERSKRIRAVLDRGFEDRRLVRISRTVRGAEPTDGVVVAQGVRWVLVHRLSADLDLDGYTALRWKHLKKAESFDPGSLPARALAGETPRLPPTDVADTTTTGSLLRSISTTFTLVAVHAESTKPPVCIVGEVVTFAGKAVLLEPAVAAGTERRAPAEVRFENITRIDFGTRYLEGLARANTNGSNR